MRPQRRVGGLFAPLALGHFAGNRGSPEVLPIMAKSRLTRGLRDQIAVELRSDIVAGRFNPGLQMVERQLAERFGVSHAPIREALLQLSHEGLLVSQTNRGAQVAPFLESSIRRFFMAIRMSLETYALRLSFEKLGESEFAAWDEILRALEAAREASDAPAIAELDFTFHEAIICQSGQNDMVSAWRTVVARARVYAAEWLTTNDNAVADHAPIVAHLRERNIEEAVRALENNVRAEIDSISDVVPSATG
jgi:GntR family transcriptional regulator, rspAB operon transcriptional repressor